MDSKLNLFSESQVPKTANAEEAAEAEDEMSKKEKYGNSFNSFNCTRKITRILFRKRRKADLIDFSAEFDFGDIFDHGTKNYSTTQLPKASDVRL
jgi:hypothetical protein